MLQIFLNASLVTLQMVVSATICALLLGTPLGLWLEAASNETILPHKYLWIYKIISKLISLILHIPKFLILLILILLANNLLYENFTLQLSISFAIGIIGAFIFAQDLARSLHNVPIELAETAKFLGASPIQILTKFLIPQAIQPIIKNIFKLIIQLTNLTIIASILGIEGIGKIALEQGFNQAELSYLGYAVVFASSIIGIFRFIEFLILNYFTHKCNGNF